MKDQCTSIRPRFSDLLDGVLDAEEERRVREHLEGCEECRAEFQAMRRAVQEVNDLPAMTAPSGFDRRVMKRIAESQATSRSRGVVRLAFRLAPVAALFLVVLGVTLAIYSGAHPAARQAYEAARAPLRDKSQEPVTDTMDEVAEDVAGPARREAPEALPAPNVVPGERSVHEEGAAAPGEPSSVEAEESIRTEMRARRPGRGASGDDYRVQGAGAGGAADRMESEVDAEKTAAFGETVRPRADQLLVIHTDEPDRIGEALAGFASADEDGPSAGLVAADKGAYYLAVPATHYDSVLKQLARLTPADHRQDLMNLDEDGLEVLRDAPAWHAGFRMGMRLADEQPDQRRRYAQGKLMLQREAEPPLARESEGAVAQAAERPAADEEDIKDLGAAEVAMDDQADEPEAEEAKPDAFVTILIRVVHRGDRAEAQEEAATESAPAAEEPAE